MCQMRKAGAFFLVSILGTILSQLLKYEFKVNVITFITLVTYGLWLYDY